jgi:hypothetical protein
MEAKKSNGPIFNKESLPDETITINIINTPHIDIMGIIVCSHFTPLRISLFTIKPNTIGTMII